MSKTFDYGWILQTPLKAPWNVYFRPHQKLLPLTGEASLCQRLVSIPYYIALPAGLDVLRLIRHTLG